VELFVAEGAGILPPSNCRTGGRPWDLASRGTVEFPVDSFRLVLRDPAPTPLTTSTLHYVLEFLEFGKDPAIHRWGLVPHLELECNPSVFASLISLVSIT
jgi:hypothetical protein